MTEVLIEGAGVAGRVLHYELRRRGVVSILVDHAKFPRNKVCGGVLQWDSWEYLRSAFRISEPAARIDSIHHFWRGKKIASHHLPRPMVYISRWELDDSMGPPLTAAVPGGQSLKVNARGAASGSEGDWIGFQASSGAVEGLQMHYGRGICAGLSRTLGPGAHMALIVKRGRFQKMEELKKYLFSELRLTWDGPIKGTGRIRYGYSPEPFAVGDAKMTTFPFLGLGMKHAIFSARLLAEKISAGDAAGYANAHRRIFRKYHLFSALAGSVYDSGFRTALKPFLQDKAIFLSLYEWLHRENNG